MAKKQKKQRSMMQRNKQQQLCRKLDWATSLLAVVIILAAMGTINADYDLSKSNPQGFAMWFLLLMGWIPLELFGLIRLFFGIHQDFALAGEGPTLGVCGLAALAAVWAFIRFYLARICRPETLRAAFHFILIFACWGIFQLFCYLAALGCERSDVAPLDKKLIRKTK
ncbi:MAG: hypothetical protein IKC65_06765 [Lentisphaeria bacterium]|nr:hypothetical protein [Lentisphaeria bacterium]